MNVAVALGESIDKCIVGQLKDCIRKGWPELAPVYWRRDGEGERVTAFIEGTATEISLWQGQVGVPFVPEGMGPKGEDLQRVINQISRVIKREPGARGVINIRETNQSGRVSTQHECTRT